jgi:hypothetical protein
LVVFAVLGVAIIVAGIVGLGVRRKLEYGRIEMEHGKAALLAANAAGASKAFASAQNDFASAEDGSHSIWLRVFGAVPFVGRTPHAVSAIASAGMDTASAGKTLADAIGSLPDGLGSLAPTRGGVPLAKLETLTPAVARADALTTAALSNLETAPSGHLVLGPVADALRRALDQVGQIQRQIHAAHEILDGLPGFLGQSGPSRFFFGAENPAELRGTGGIIGAYSILTIDRGRFSFSPFRPVEGLPLLNVRTTPSPSTNETENYAFFRRGSGFWLNANMTPDFPSAAQTLAAAYTKATGIRLAGVITADPFALKALLETTGPSLIPGLGVRVTPSNVVSFTTNGAYSRFGDQSTRKLVLGDVAQEVFKDFLASTTGTSAKIRTLSKAASDGHIHVWSSDPSMESGFAATGVGGAFDPPTGTDLLSVIQNNSSGTKLDYYQHRTIEDDITLGPDGTAEATVKVSLENPSPTSGLPRYVIGPHPPATQEAGENIAMSTVYCGSGCQLANGAIDGKPAKLNPGTELGHPYYQARQKIAPGSTGLLDVELSLPRAWQGDSSGGTYSLTFVNQPTINPTNLIVNVTVPDGMHVVSLTPGMTRTGNTVQYKGVPKGDLALQVSFKPSLLVRVWRDVLRPFERPVSQR